MERKGIFKQNFEMMLLDLTEGILVGGLAGFLLGLLFGTMVWGIVWQALPNVGTLPPIFYAGQLGTLDGVVIGGTTAFFWRLKRLLNSKQEVLF